MGWVALYSGGKDSSWALHRARAEGLSLERLLTARPRGDSFLFHVPATELAEHLAACIGIPHESFELETAEADGIGDAGTGGDRELERLAEALERLDGELHGGITGLVSGAVASTFQRDRIDRLCERYDFEHVAPLWNRDGDETLRAMIEAGFDIRVVGVAAAGLDRSWLGRRLDARAIEELADLRDRHGIHPLGEGGEYETIVVGGPHMDGRVRFEAEPRWDGVRGHLVITDARIEGEPSRARQ